MLASGWEFAPFGHRACPPRVLGFRDIGQQVGDSVKDLGRPRLRAMIRRNGSKGAGIFWVIQHEPPSFLRIPGVLLLTHQLKDSQAPHVD